MAEHINEKFSPRTSPIRSLRIDKDGVHIAASAAFFMEVSLGQFGASLPRAKGSVMETTIPPKFENRPDNVQEALSYLIDTAQQNPRSKIPAQFIAEAARKEGLTLDVPGPGRSPF
jgi:hypothetical protein